MVSMRRWAPVVVMLAMTLGCAAGAARPREEAVEQKAPKARKQAPRRQEGPSELERIEAEIAERENNVADLERRLADDWNDVETLAAHRQARHELQTLLERWESAFERAQT